MVRLLKTKVDWRGEGKLAPQRHAVKSSKEVLVLRFVLSPRAYYWCPGCAVFPARNLSLHDDRDSLLLKDLICTDLPRLVSCFWDYHCYGVMILSDLLLVGGCSVIKLLIVELIVSTRKVLRMTVVSCIFLAQSSFQIACDTPKSNHVYRFAKL